MIGAAALGVGGIISSLVSNQTNQQANDRAFNQASYQYEDSKRYNSAYQQVMRLRAAGINPAFAFGQNAGQAVGQSVPSPIPQQPLDLSGLANIAQGMSMNDVNRARTLSEERLNVIKADSQQFDLALNQLFGAKERSAALSHTMADASRLFQQTMLLKEQGETEKALQSYYSFHAALADATASLTGKQKELVEKELQWYDARARQGLAIGRSQISANNASAENLRASAASTRLDTSIRNATSPHEIAKAIDDAMQSSNAALIGVENLRAARAAAEQAEYASSNKEAIFWKDFVLDLIGGAVDVATVKTRITSSRAFRDMSVSDRKRVENEATRIANEYKLGSERNAIQRSDRSARTYTFDKNGNAHKRSQTDYKIH